MLSCYAKVVGELQGVLLLNDATAPSSSVDAAPAAKRARQPKVTERLDVRLTHERLEVQAAVEQEIQKNLQAVVAERLSLGEQETVWVPKGNCNRQVKYHLHVRCQARLPRPPQAFAGIGDSLLIRRR